MNSQPIHIASMEPLLPRAKRDNSALSYDILLQAGALKSALPDVSTQQVAALVAGMNSYYSNLIEGHRTYPGEIDAALKADDSADPKKSALQKLGVAHEAVEHLMRQRLQTDTELELCSEDFICWLHFELYSRLPEQFRIVKDADGKAYTVEPGKFRDHPAHVGHHIAPRADKLSRFVARFAEVYSFKSVQPADRLIAAMAAHHRFMWIHPFADGNGRVARLLTTAHLIKAGVDDLGLWSWARGLARSREAYYGFLEDADHPRRGDRDGRGQLSDASLNAFIQFGLETIKDQIQFMSDKLDLLKLETRLEDHIRREQPFGVTKNSDAYVRILIEILRRGELARGMVAPLIGKAPRTARPFIGALEKAGYVTSDGPKKALRITFAPALRDTCFPRLFIP
ncbi:MAG TPA: Fic family protein [Opitutae bacterium]|nr:Fic family protein [Opitutae bacterium]